MNTTLGTDNAHWDISTQIYRTAKGLSTLAICEAYRISPSLIGENHPRTEANASLAARRFAVAGWAHGYLRKTRPSSQGRRTRFGLGRKVVSHRARGCEAWHRWQQGHGAVNSLRKTETSDDVELKTRVHGSAHALDSALSTVCVIVLLTRSQIPSPASISQHPVGRGADAHATINTKLQDSLASQTLLCLLRRRRQTPVTCLTSPPLLSLSLR